MTFIGRTLRVSQWSIEEINRLSAVVDLVIRLLVANVFWKSGLTKIATWDSTLYLFEYEYAVPLVPTEVAAILGTGIEITMPILLAIGLGTRFSALVLFIFNIIAVVSYPTLNEVGIKDHQFWGILLLVTIFQDLLNRIGIHDASESLELVRTDL